MENAAELAKMRALAKASEQTSDRLRVELAAAHNRLENLRAEMELGRRKSLLSEAAPGEMQQQLHAVQAALAASQLRIADLEQSLSWRLTAPLRTVGKLFMKS